MPIYEYECGSCGKYLEVTQRMVDPPLVHCDACGTDSLKKLMSRSAFQLKGGGWYSDLYSSTKKDAPKADSAPAAASSTASAPAAAAPASSSSSSGTSAASSSSAGSSTASA